MLEIATEPQKVQYMALLPRLNNAILHSKVVYYVVAMPRLNNAMPRLNNNTHSFATERCNEISTLLT